MKIKRVMAAVMAATVAFGTAACGGVHVTTKDEPQKETAEHADTQTKDPVVTGEDEPVTLRVVDWSDSTKVRREAFHQKFMEENPNVTIEYTVLTADQFKESVISSIKSGDAPDLFPLPSGMKLQAAVDENWYLPLNDYLGEEFFGAFADGALNEGITTLDGNVYVLPESANIINTLLFYNKTVLEEAGVEKLPETWSEFYDVCEQVTEAGNGKYYGIIDSGAQANRLELFLRSLASLEGAQCGDISQMLLVDGQNTMNSEGMIKAFEYYDSLVKAGVFHPNSVTLKAPEARALFAQNQAAFICQGAWCISTWKAENPDLDFGVMAIPIPDDGAKGKLPYIGAQPWMGISTNCEHPDVAAKYLKALYSEEYQSGLVEDGGFVSVIDAVNEKYMTDEQMLAYYQLNQEAAALVPDPLVGNPATAEVYAQTTAISPNLGEIAQGVLAQSVDYKTQLRELGEKTQTEWERAIGAAKEAGADVDVSDFEFKNWDPMKNYTTEDYSNR